MTTLYKKLTKDLLLIGSAQILVRISSIILIPILTKTISIQEFGIWSQAQVTIGLVWALVGLGLPSAMVRFLASNNNKSDIQEQYYSVFAFVFIITSIVSGILIAFAEPIAAAFFDGATNVFRITGMIAFIWSLDSVMLTLFRTFRRMKLYAIITVVDIYAQIAIIVFLVSQGYGIYELVLVILGVRLAIFIVLFVIVKRNIGLKIPHFTKIKEYFRFGLPTVPAIIASWIVDFGDRYVIGYVSGTAFVGIYAVAYAFGAIPLFVVRIFGYVLMPTLSKCYDEGRIDEVKKILSFTTKFLLILTIPFICGAAVLSKQTLQLFTTEYIASEGYLILPIIALATTFFSLCEPFAEVLMLTKKTKIIGAAFTFIALLNLVLNILLVPVWGIMAAAITTLISFFVLFCILAFYSRKSLRFKIEANYIIKSLIATAIMGAIIFFINPQGNLRTIATIAIGTVVYVVVFISIKGFERKEIRFFLNIFKNKINSD